VAEKAVAEKAVAENLKAVNQLLHTKGVQAKEELEEKVAKVPDHLKREEVAQKAVQVVAKSHNLPKKEPPRRELTRI
jgi:hypothetical protein